MIGYYRKDFYLQKKLLVLLGILYIVLLGFGLAFSYSYDYGNLAKQSAPSVTIGKTTCETLLPIVIAFLVCAIMSTVPLMSIDMDIKNHFNLFSFSTGSLEKEQLKAKLTELVTTFFVANTAMLVYGTVFGILFGFKNFSTGFAIGYPIILLFLCLVCVAIPLTYFLKKFDLAIGILAIFIWLSSLLFTFFNSSKVEKWLENFNQGQIENPKGLFTKYPFVIAIASVLVLAVFFAIAYFGSLIVMKRRDRLCWG